MTRRRIIRIVLCAVLGVLPGTAARLAFTVETNKVEQAVAPSLPQSSTNAVAELKPEPRLTETARTLARRLPAEHLTHMPVDDMISLRTWENYISSLDPNRVYFLESDIASFKQYDTHLDDALKKGDLSFAYEVFRVFKEHAADRLKFTEQLLENGFDLDKDESFHWRRDDAPWPASREEWDELWRKRIKNAYVQLLVVDKLEEEGKDKEEESGKKDGENKDDEKKEPDKVDKPSPAEVILKQQRQLIIALDQSDSESVLARYLAAFTRAYDPHCDYMTPRAEENFDIEMKLSLCGIGAVLTSEDGYVKISRILPGGPAERDKRLKEGDKIIAVAQDKEPPVDIINWSLDKAVGLIRGEKDTRVVLTIIPASDPTETTTEKIDIVRDNIKLEERVAKSEVRTVQTEDGRERRLAVIYLPTFYSDMKERETDPDNCISSTRDVRNILVNMRTNNVEGILLDLRNNGGGALFEAVFLTGLFIQNGPIVQVKQIDSRPALWDRDPEIVYSGPLIVLVNRASASASEILAGALQDYSRAIIVGDSHTFGKGTVQAIIDLDKKMGAMKVTNALFYRITGSSTQLKGVSPEIVIPSPSEFAEIGESYLSNPLEWSRERGVNYWPFADLTPAVRVLTEKSGKRRSESRQYAAYTNVLASVETMQKMEELPLNFEKRLEQARERKRLIDAQNELAGDDKERDIVLSESLNILSDLVDWSNIVLKNR